MQGIELWSLVLREGREAKGTEGWRESINVK